MDRTPAEFVGNDSVWKLLKPVYGIFSAPKSWYDKLHEVLFACSFEACLSDDGLFRIANEQGDVIGIIAMHVDYAMGGGTDELCSAMNEVCRILKISSHEKEAFTYKGLRFTTVYQEPNKPFEIALDGDDYIGSAEYMSEVEGPSMQFLAPDKHLEYRSVVGKISYVAGAFRPELCGHMELRAGLPAGVSACTSAIGMPLVPMPIVNSVAVLHGCMHALVIF